MFSCAPAYGIAVSLLFASGLAQGACDALKPYAGESTTPSHEQQIDQGRQAFESNCAVCHGMDASGGRGPNLRRAHIARAPNDAALCELIETGIPPEMPAGAFLTDVEVRALVAFVSSLRVSAAAAIAGDPARGARIFAGNGCSSCHILAGKGNALGPQPADDLDQMRPRAGEHCNPILAAHTLSFLYGWHMRADNRNHRVSLRRVQLIRGLAVLFEDLYMQVHGIAVGRASLARY